MLIYTILNSILNSKRLYLLNYAFAYVRTVHYYYINIISFPQYFLVLLITFGTDFFLLYFEVAAPSFFTLKIFLLQ